MNKQLIDSAWRALPAEFKEEVKKIYAMLLADLKMYKGDNPEQVGTTDPILWERTLVIKSTLCRLFGERNLTSDAEGEEILTVRRKKVQGLYDLAYEIYADGTKEWYQGYMKAMQDLFGSKCLPDEEPLFSNQPENYNNENPIVASENKPTESTCTDDCPSPCPSQHFDNIINQSFADHNRLHIAAMLAAGMLANEVRCYPIDRALELADQLITACKKGGQDA